MVLCHSSGFWAIAIKQAYVDLAHHNDMVRVICNLIKSLLFDLNHFQPKCLTNNLIELESKESLELDSHSWPVQSQLLELIPSSGFSLHLDPGRLIFSSGTLSPSSFFLLTLNTFFFFFLKSPSRTWLHWWPTAPSAPSPQSPCGWSSLPASVALSSAREGPR